jgi:hypothetical protein
MNKIQTKINVPKEWVLESTYSEVKKGHALLGYIRYFIIYTFLPLSTYVYLTERPTGFLDLMPALGLGLVFVSGFSFYHYYNWYTSLGASAKSFEYIATVCENNVEISYVTESQIYSWDQYLCYKEEDNRLTIFNLGGGKSFIPRNSDTLELIIFTKNQIDNNKHNRSNESLHRTVN